MRWHVCYFEDIIFAVRVARISRRSHNHHQSPLIQTLLQSVHPFCKFTPHTMSRRSCVRGIRDNTAGRPCYTVTVT